MVRFIPVLIAICAFPLAAMAEVKQGAPNAGFKPAFKNQTRAPEIRDGTRLQAQRIASGLHHPWGIAVLPDGGYLVTERRGRLQHVSASGKVTRIKGAPRVAVKGQGGLLDIALADDFASSRRVFLTYSKPMGGRKSATAAGVATLSANNKQLSGFRDIFVNTPGVNSGGHFGSRIVIRGNAAFITVGDRNQENMPQDLKTTVGKVVRVAVNGQVPKSNPFVGQRGARPEIWSYGHRNPQGAAIHPRTGELWTLEHGPRGGDELNLIQPGVNYGWPLVSYGIDYSGAAVGRGISRGKGMAEPRYYWDPVIAPGDLTFYDGAMLKGWSGDAVAASLKPGGIVRLKIRGNRVTGEARYLRQLGRVRDVAVDRDGALLVITDDPKGGLFRVTPAGG